MTDTTHTRHRVALVTGGSAGLGLALTKALVTDGWHVVTDARDPDRLTEATSALGGAVSAIPGDVGDRFHRNALIRTATELGRLDLLVHNASTLGPIPLSTLSGSGSDDLANVLRVNTEAPLRLTVEALPLLRESSGTVLSISSDAAVNNYEGWGLYGAAKAALDHLTLTFAQEEPGVRWYAVDPGDMRTEMHQAAFLGEDISDRPLPETVIPHLLGLLVARPESGRYQAATLPVVEPTVVVGDLA